ncbi:MAG TPA: YfiR family protein [Syntrophorhabdaceae bacterium]|jgi:hypothetical protein
MKDPPRRIRSIIFSLLCLSLLLAGSPGYGREQQFTEYEVKAAFVFNMAKFVEWPEKGAADAREGIDLCLLGIDQFSGVFDQINGKFVKGRRLSVRQISSIKNSKGCNIVFISGSEKERVPDIVDSLKGTGVLTMGDTSGYGQRGVMINFYMDGKKVRFEANPDSAKRSGLTISAQLLKLARIVRSD